ncbi:hypothetical protein B4U80_13612 [Leptotrombidium deliense]|uniref:non-specific serine/threonine protein kinase n=1 Tax=Leptotrombidium deliense TaxID=299467 RepID=A0A443STL7_9ACAR|nr:hypothetical protein B4U80_13612 [Leptotrombidium deliense]
MSDPALDSSDEVQVSENEYKPSFLEKALRKLPISVFNRDKRPVKVSACKAQASSDFYSHFIEKKTYSDEYRSQVLDFCGQQEPITFDKLFPKHKYRSIMRFDSGTYADVYKVRNPKDGKWIVLKIVRTVSKSLQKQLTSVSFSGTETFDDIFNELVISKALSKLHHRSFSEPKYLAHCYPVLLDAKLVKGNLPDNFVRGEKCEDTEESPQRNEPFSDYTGAPIEFVVFIMKYGGEPIWKMIKEKRIDGAQLLSISKQVTFGLAVAELCYEYEHRDLHISNILVKKTKKPYIRFHVDGVFYDVETAGFRACIVDHTFSRLKHRDTVYYKDMREILKSKKEDKVTLQHQVYKWMINETNNEWNLFCPKTNLFWLYYLFSTLQKSSLVREHPAVKKEFEQIAKQANNMKSTNEILDFIVQLTDGN